MNLRGLPRAAGQILIPEGLPGEQILPTAQSNISFQAGVKVGHENGASMLFGEIQIAYFARGPTRMFAWGLHSLKVVLNLRQRQV